MADFSSFTRVEHELSHKYRNDLNHAESVADVRRCFAFSMQDMIGRVLGDSVALREDDVALAAGGGYAISPRLAADAGFARAMRDSDLGAILSRFAESAGHRLLHLQAHADRSLTQTRRR